MDATVSAQEAARVDAVRRRRAELLESLTVVEQALAAAASGRAVIWGERVHDALTHLEHDFRDHIEVTEGPEGLHQSILVGDLRLANAVQALTAEHVTIAAGIGTAITATQPPVTADDVAVVRDQVVHLLGRIVRHRQKGADLVYEAFETDIGGDG